MIGSSPTHVAVSPSPIVILAALASSGDVIAVAARQSGHSSLSKGFPQIGHTNAGIESLTISEKWGHDARLVLGAACISRISFCTDALVIVCSMGRRNSSISSGSVSSRR